MKKRNSDPRIPEEYLGAFKQGHRPTVREFIDDRFSYQLLAQALAGNAEAREMLKYLTRFYNEYYKSVFTHTRKDLHRRKTQKRERYNAQNANYRDVTKQFFPATIIMESVPSTDNEDKLIELIDIKNEMQKSKKQ